MLMRGNMPQDTKMHFPCHARADWRLFETMHTFKSSISNECMAISMLNHTAQRQNYLQMIFVTQELLVLGVQPQLVTWSTPLQMSTSTICFILYWQQSLIE